MTAFAHEQPLWFYLGMLPLLLWPWGWTRRGLAALAPRRLWSDEPSRFVAVWAGSTFLAFSLISGKQSHYLLPELPALALLLSGMGLPREGARWTRLLPLLPAAAIFLLILATALGFVPKVAVTGGQVTWIGVVTAAAILAALLAGTLWPREAWPAFVLAAPFTLLMFLAAASPLLFAGYDAAPIGRILAANEARGIATADSSYHGQFNFAGRLAGPVAHPASPEALAAWAADHPGGLVVSREDLSLEPLKLIERRWFRGRGHGLYRVQETSR